MDSNRFSSICFATALNKQSKRCFIGQGCAFVSFPLWSLIKSLNNEWIGSALFNDSLQSHTLCNFCCLCWEHAQSSLHRHQRWVRCWAKLGSAAWQSRSLTLLDGELSAWVAHRAPALILRPCFNKSFAPSNSLDAFFPYKELNPNTRKSTLENHISSFVATKRNEVVRDQHNVGISCECLMRCLPSPCLRCPFGWSSMSRTSQKGYTEKSVFPRYYCREVCCTKANKLNLCPGLLQGTKDDRQGTKCLSTACKMGLLVCHAWGEEHCDLPAPKCTKALGAHWVVQPQQEPLKKLNHTWLNLSAQGHFYPYTFITVKGLQGLMEIWVPKSP